MQPVTAAPRYDRTTIALHWATAALIVAQWCVAKVIDDFPRGDPRVTVRSVHLTIGVILVLLIATRVVWRATRGRRLPAADRGALHVVAKATHWGLYALVLTTLAGGLTLWWLRGDSWFLLFRPSAPDPANRDLSHTVGYFHSLFGTCILILAAVHAAAALVHRYVWRDGVLNRMLMGAGRVT